MNESLGGGVQPCTTVVQSGRRRFSSRFIGLRSNLACALEPLEDPFYQDQVGFERFDFDF